MNYEEFCAALQEELFNRLDTSYSGNMCSKTTALFLIPWLS